MAKYSPIDPVVISTSTPAPNSNAHDGNGLCLSAIYGDNADLMENISKLWIKKEDAVVDVTFGKGAFWKKLKNLPTYSHDLKLDGVDCRTLPYVDNSLDVVVFDPPYRPTHGSKSFGNNALASCYQLGKSSLDTINDVIDLYRKGIVEAFRVLKKGGRILVKCQDLSYCHKLHLVSLDVLREINNAGFDFADQFILINKTQMSSPKWAKQERARRSHSILWVGIKR